MTKFLVNPFFVYIISFTIVLLVYSLGWSDLYPDLSLSLLGFFFITFIISFFLGIAVHFLKRIQYSEIAPSDRTKFYLLLTCIGYCLEFIYNKGVPLQMLLQGLQYDYTGFGIPVFHVFLVTFSSFLSVYIFHQLCSNFDKRQLTWFLLSIAPPILIINRGMLFMILTSCLFVYLLSLKKIRVKTFIVIISIILVVFYFFGVMGNLRQTKGKKTSSEYILESSKATSSFKDSRIPKEYIWSYVYISSPLANLQNTIEKSSRLDNSWVGFLNFEILPDFISKRTAVFFNIEREYPVIIAPWLTVATFYSSSFVYLGWIGIILIFGFFLLTTLLYLLILKKTSRYYITGLAILNTLVLYNTFDNMYYFSGLNLQLAYPLILSIMSYYYKK